MKDKLQLIQKSKKISHLVTLVLTAFWFGFSLLSGAEDFGGGFQGVLRNSPNALPWFFLLIFVYFYWYYEIISASMILVIGLATLFFYGALQSTFVLFAITLPLLILGTLLLVSALLSRQIKQE